MKPSYIPNFAHALHCPDEILADLLRLRWLSVTEARQEYFMSDLPRLYTYGTPQHAREYHSSDYSPMVKLIQDSLNACGWEYNVCFLNRYDNQKNQLGWHADDSPEMDRYHPIAVVSFGAEREIWWRLNDSPGVVPAGQRQKLAHGSMFIMPAFFQDTYQHRIPRADREVGVRVSLTFRRYV